jgi:tellurite resistance protein TerA
MTINYSKSASPASPAAPAAGGAGPTRVSLTKTAPTVSLSKQSGRLRINLNWDAHPPQAKRGGFLKLFADDSGIDLDLGCLWELVDGTKGVVQALGNQFGDLDRAPYIHLSGDDRTGANAGGEDLFVNLARAAEIRRIIVFACVYSGASGFDQVNGVVTLTPESGPPLEVRLDERAGGSRMCAVALLEGGPAGLTVRREVRYIRGAQDALDREYGWGMNWSAGRK